MENPSVCQDTPIKNTSYILQLTTRKWNYYHKSVLKEDVYIWFGLVWFGGFYGISTFIGYLTPNPFLCK